MDAASRVCLARQMLVCRLLGPHWGEVTAGSKECRKEHDSACVVAPPAISSDTTTNGTGLDSMVAFDKLFLGIVHAVLLWRVFGGSAVLAAFQEIIR
jgi:hypothetical protein